MTMKMISSTSITSTIGVTLMLELTFLPSSRLLIPMLYAPSCSQRPVAAYGLQPLHPLARRALPSGCRSLATPGEIKAKSSDRKLRSHCPKAIGLAVALLDEVVHQLAGAVVHLDVERLYLAGKVVEGHNG